MFWQQMLIGSGLVLKNHVCPKLPHCECAYVCVGVHYLCECVSVYICCVCERQYPCLSLSWNPSCTASR